MSESNLKKISAYVPPQVFKKLKESADKEKISLSQAIIGALVKAYEIEDIEIGKPSKRIVVGADTETKKRIESLEHKVDQILDQMLSKQQIITQTTNEEVLEHNKVINNGMLQNKPTDKLLDNLPKKENAKQLTLDPPIHLKPLTGVALAKRLNCDAKILSNYKSIKSKEEFMRWSASKDPNNISWIPGESRKGYYPSEETTEEQLKDIKHLLEIK